jgi:hypothetical protein
LQVRIKRFAALVSSFVVDLAIGLRDDRVEERVGFQLCFRGRQTVGREVGRRVDEAWLLGGIKALLAILREGHRERVRRY